MCHYSHCSAAAAAAAARRSHGAVQSWQSVNYWLNESANSLTCTDLKATRRTQPPLFGVEDQSENIFGGFSWPLTLPLVSHQGSVKKVSRPKCFESLARWFDVRWSPTMKRTKTSICHSRKLSLFFFFLIQKSFLFVGLKIFCCLFFEFVCKVFMKQLCRSFSVQIDLMNLLMIY